MAGFVSAGRKTAEVLLSIIPPAGQLVAGFQVHQLSLRAAFWIFKINPGSGSLSSIWAQATCSQTTCSKSGKVQDPTAALPHVNTRWDHGDAKPHGGGYKLWGDPRVNKFLITYNKNGVKLIIY